MKIAGVLVLLVNGVSHNDLHLGNILVNNENGQMKYYITDFGRAYLMIPEDQAMLYCGLREISPPEQYNTFFGPVDLMARAVFQIGIIAFQLAYDGERPYRGQSNQVVYLNDEGHVFFPEWLSLAGQDFLQRCLWNYSAYRMSLHQLLHHPFLKQLTNQMQDNSAVIRFAKIYGWPKAINQQGLKGSDEEIIQEYIGLESEPDDVWTSGWILPSTIDARQLALTSQSPSMDHVPIHPTKKARTNPDRMVQQVEHFQGKVNTDGYDEFFTV